MSSSACHVRVRVGGELTSESWSAIFMGLAVEPAADSTTLVSGELPDQAALHGLLAAIRDLGLTLLSVATSAPTETGPGEDRHRSEEAR